MGCMFKGCRNMAVHGAWGGSRCETHKDIVIQPYASLNRCRDAVEDLEIMFQQLCEVHKKTGYHSLNDMVGIDANLDNVRAAIKDVSDSVNANLPLKRSDNG